MGWPPTGPKQRNLNMTPYFPLYINGILCRGRGCSFLDPLGCLGRNPKPFSFWDSYRDLFGTKGAQHVLMRGSYL